MNEKELLKYLSAAIFFVLGILLIYDATSDYSKKPSSQATKNPPKKNPGVKVKGGKTNKKKLGPIEKSGGNIHSFEGEFCQDVLESCTAQIEYQDENCDEKAAKAEIGKMLEKPVNNVHCQDIYDRLNAGCPSGCELDQTSLVILPSKLIFSFDEEDECLASGEKIVNIRGSCVYGRSEESAE